MPSAFEVAHRDRAVELAGAVSDEAAAVSAVGPQLPDFGPLSKDDGTEASALPVGVPPVSTAPAAATVQPSGPRHEVSEEPPGEPDLGVIAVPTPSLDRPTGPVTAAPRDREVSSPPGSPAPTAVAPVGPVVPPTASVAPTPLQEAPAAQDPAPRRLPPTLPPRPQVVGPIGRAPRQALRPPVQMKAAPRGPNLPPISSTVPSLPPMGSSPPTVLAPTDARGAPTRSSSDDPGSNGGPLDEGSSTAPPSVAAPVDERSPPAPQASFGLPDDLLAAIAPAPSSTGRSIGPHPPRVEAESSPATGPLLILNSSPAGEPAALHDLGAPAVAGVPSGHAFGAGHPAGPTVAGVPSEHSPGAGRTVVPAALADAGSPMEEERLVGGRRAEVEAAPELSRIEPRPLFGLAAARSPRPAPRPAVESEVAAVVGSPASPHGPLLPPEPPPTLPPIVITVGEVIVRWEEASPSDSPAATMAAPGRALEDYLDTTVDR